MKKRFSQNNANISYKFLTRLRLENKSYGRVGNYADCCIRILKLKDDKNIQDWTRNDIEEIYQDELLKLIQAVKTIGGRYVKRNIAIIYLMLEGSYRPCELFNIVIGGIEFHDDFVRVSTTGKTGPKSLTLVASYIPLKEWIDLHPKSNDPDSFLLYDDNEDNLMKYT